MLAPQLASVEQSRVMPPSNSGHVAQYDSNHIPVVWESRVLYLQQQQKLVAECYHCEFIEQT